ncbi:MAG: cytidylate kinase [Candidatus Omnitrophica bacterium CG1_02_44_16]|nr:MAG: cytidylate kinase [Candidatus Omnitrophica bacterium CG1_02_44_16]PIY83187.1 MAG: cytidylate kinase [Candidatus Omnitrophica bacterium CG_4_10_14_0_8_um_filter_44_12]PIZ83077.1 MAG: cytidylate kinase [Candidatus Omnitrophica bacterium CG_4_10_14_0_2_um_filter_44_9]
MTSRKPIIAIDGPAGSGKSTVAKLVAKKLKLFYIDTGAMYRVLALKAQMLGISHDDEKKIIELALNCDIRLDYDPASAQLKVYCDGKDVTEDIRKPQIAETVSFIAKIKKVRERMVILQRHMAEGKKAILEGRDTTTVVFPDAYKKFYLDADLQERTKRRFLEMKEKNIPIDEPDVKKDITQRDRLDSTREHSPLRRADDAVYIDTTDLSIGEVVDTIIAEVNKQ